MPRIVDGKPVEEGGSNENESSAQTSRSMSVPLVSDQTRYLISGIFLLMSFIFFGWKGLLISLLFSGVMYFFMNRMGPINIGGAPPLPTTREPSNNSSSRPSNRPSNVRTMDDLPKEKNQPSWGSEQC